MKCFYSWKTVYIRDHSSFDKKKKKKLLRRRLCQIPIIPVTFS